MLTTVSAVSAADSRAGQWIKPAPAGTVQNNRRSYMAATTFAVPQIQLEDPLWHLPCSNILAYQKGQTIYGHDRPPTRLYLVIDGKVKICRTGDHGRAVVVDIYQ